MESGVLQHHQVHSEFRRRPALFNLPRGEFPANACPNFTSRCIHVHLRDFKQQLKSVPAQRRQSSATKIATARPGLSSPAISRLRNPISPPCSRHSRSPPPLAVLPSTPPQPPIPWRKPSPSSAAIFSRATFPPRKRTTATVQQDLKGLADTQLSSHIHNHHRVASSGGGGVEQSEFPAPGPQPTRTEPHFHQPFQRSTGVLHLAATTATVRPGRRNPLLLRRRAPC